MSSPFQYYKRIDFSNVDSGDDETVYTTEYPLSLIQVVFTDLDISGTESVTAYAEAPFGEEDIVLAENFGASNTTSGANLDQRTRCYSAVIDSGRDIKVNPIGENNVDGRVYVFRIQGNYE